MQFGQSKVEDDKLAASLQLSKTPLSKRERLLTQQVLAVASSDCGPPLRDGSATDVEATVRIVRQALGKVLRHDSFASHLTSCFVQVCPTAKQEEKALWMVHRLRQLPRGPFRSICDSFFTLSYTQPLFLRRRSVIEFLDEGAAASKLAPNYTKGDVTRLLGVSHKRKRALKDLKDDGCEREPKRHGNRISAQAEDVRV
jgi:hypothetical protein